MRRASRRERVVALRDERARRLVLLEAEDARELRQVGDPLFDPPGKAHVDAEPVLRERLEIALGVLFLVGQDQVRLERANDLEVGVLRAADDAYVSPASAQLVVGAAAFRGDVVLVGGQLAVGRAPDQRGTRSEARDAVRVARYQRHDARGHRAEEQLAAAVVADLGDHAIDVYLRR